MTDDPAFECLAEFIREEFRGLSEVRVRLRHPSTTTRSPDLEQNYDPTQSHVHLQEGVVVRVRGREYFFPAAWSRPCERAQVEALVREIRALIGADESTIR